MNALLCTCSSSGGDCGSSYSGGSSFPSIPVVYDDSGPSDCVRARQPVLRRLGRADCLAAIGAAVRGWARHHPVANRRITYAVDTKRRKLLKYYCDTDRRHRRSPFVRRPTTTKNDPRNSIRLVLLCVRIYTRRSVTTRRRTRAIYTIN